LAFINCSGLRVTACCHEDAGRTEDSQRTDLFHYPHDTTRNIYFESKDALIKSQASRNARMHFVGMAGRILLWIWQNDLPINPIEA